MPDFNELIAFAFGEEELKAEIDKWLEFVALSVGEDGNVGGQEHRDLLFFLFEFRKALFAPATIDNLGKLMGETYGLSISHYLPKTMREVKYTKICCYSCIN